MSSQPTQNNNQQPVMSYNSYTGTPYNQQTRESIPPQYNGMMDKRVLQALGYAVRRLGESYQTQQPFTPVAPNDPNSYIKYSPLSSNPIVNNQNTQLQTHTSANTNPVKSPSQSSDDILQKISDWLRQLDQGAQSTNQWWNQNTPTQYTQQLNNPQNVLPLFTGIFGQDSGTKLYNGIANAWSKIQGVQK